MRVPVAVRHWRTGDFPRRRAPHPVRPRARHGGSFVTCMPTALAEGCRMSERSFLMPLPPIAFYSIYEIAVRWGCHPADVAGWAAAGHLQVLAGIPPVSCGEETVAGLVEVPIAELMPMFRRYGPSEEHARLKRVLAPGSKTWLKVTDPSDCLPIRSPDLLLAA